MQSTLISLPFIYPETLLHQVANAISESDLSHLILNIFTNFLQIVWLFEMARIFSGTQISDYKHTTIKYFDRLIPLQNNNLCCVFR